MKILITGGSGFVAEHLVNALLRLGHDVTVISRTKSARWSTFVKVITLDTYRNVDIDRALFETKPNVIFHAAGSRVRAPVTEMTRTALDHSAWDLSFIQSCARLDCLDAFFYFGTADLFASDSIVIKPSTKRVARNSYGMRKLWGASLVESLSQSVGFPGVVLVPSVIYGPRQAPDMFIPSLIDALLEGRAFEMTSGYSYVTLYT